MSVNKAILIANLGKDPELRITSTGRAVGRFPIATSEVWTDAEGNRQERTEWHNIVVWGKQAEVLVTPGGVVDCRSYLPQILLELDVFVISGEVGKRPDTLDPFD